MDNPAFVYVTYIATTPERLWESLTSGEFTQRYWFGRRVESDWRVGSRVSFWDGSKLTDSGEVLVCDPPKSLAYTFRVEWDEQLSQEAPSRVTFELEPAGDAVKLTVIHEELADDSVVLIGIRQGWPKILSSLKSLLETGATLSIATAEAGKREAERVVTAARSVSGAV